MENKRTKQILYFGKCHAPLIKLLLSSSLPPRGLLWGNLIRDLMLEKDYFVVTSTREKRGVLYLEDDQFELSSISASLGKISSMIDDNKRWLE